MDQYSGHGTGLVHRVIRATEDESEMRGSGGIQQVCIVL